MTELAGEVDDDRERQRLDDIAGMVISLRGALEAAGRLSDASPSHSTVRAAALDLVVLRAEDLDAALRAFEERLA